MPQFTDIYVDPKKGYDAWNGTCPTVPHMNGPFKTIARAVTKIKGLRMTGNRTPITVWLMPGEHMIDNTIIIPEGCDNITFRAYDEGVTVMGAKRLTDLKVSELYGTKCLSATVPEGCIPDDLYANGKRADITKYPENGTIAPLRTGSEPPAGGGTDWMIADRDLSAFEGIYDATISFNHYWVNERLRIESIDPETNKVVFSNATCFSAYTNPNNTPGHASEANDENAPKNNRDDLCRMDYVIEGLPMMLKKANQWVYKKEENKVYFVPHDFDAENELFMPTVKTIFTVRASSVLFEGITFKYTSSQFEGKRTSTSRFVEGKNKKISNDVQSLASAEGVLEFKGASSCRTASCVFDSYGLYGINIDNFCSDIEITRSRFLNSEGGGIKISHEDAPFNTIQNSEEFIPSASNIKITDCLIKNIGLKHTSACGILVTLAQNSLIAHNEICYTGYSGISLGWEWGYKVKRTHHNRIEKNHIHHISQGRLSDLGGIYLLGIQEGTFVSGNLIHDVYSKTYGGAGLYADEGSSLVTFENNICYNVSGYGFQLHFGYDNIVKNNILESGSMGAFYSWKNALRSTAVLKHNILIAKGNDLIFGDRSGVVPPSCISSDCNIFWHPEKGEPVIYCWGGEPKYLSDWRLYSSNDRGSAVSDPCFSDYKNGDFTLMPQSPAFELGFRKIDMSDVGIRK